MAVACVVLAAITTSPDLAQEGEMQLPPEYDYEIIYRPEITGLSGIVASHDGTLYARHLNSTGGVMVSQVDVDLGTLTTVLDLPPETSVSGIVGGPEETFFASVDGEFRQVWPDALYEVWGVISPAGFPMYYTTDDHMLGISNDGTAVLELFSDGSYDTLLIGLTSAYDLVAADDGTIFVADMGAGELVRLETGGTHSVLATIAQDNTDLAFDHGGRALRQQRQRPFLPGRPPHRSVH